MILPSVTIINAANGFDEAEFSLLLPKYGASQTSSVWALRNNYVGIDKLTHQGFQGKRIKLPLRKMGGEATKLTLLPERKKKTQHTSWLEC